HRVAIEPLGAHPGKALAFARRDHALPAAADIKRHQQMKIFVAVRGESQRRETGFVRVDAELFLELADQRRLGAFAVMHLAPGNSHRPAIALPSGRCASSTRPSASTSATATTRMTGRDSIARAIGETHGPCKRHSQLPRNRVKSAAEGNRVRSLTERLVRRVYYKYFARNLLYELQIRARAEAADYAQAHMTDALIFEKPGALLRYCVAEAPPQGAILEFGVAGGHSINEIAKAAPSRPIHGFDSFEGLPEHWSGHLTTRGAFDQRGVLPKVPANVTLHKGWFDATLPAWKAAHPD